MALLGTFIDSRTLAGLTSGGTSSFAHGLPAAPDFVIVQFIASLATSNTVSMITAATDATNVTLQNAGNVTSPSLRAISVVAHSIIR